MRRSAYKEAPRASPFRQPLFWIMSSLWVLLVLLLFGPLFVEWLDQQHLSGQLFGLPVIVTEGLLRGG